MNWYIMREIADEQEAFDMTDGISESMKYQRQMEQENEERSKEAADRLIDEVDAWPGNPIEITQVEVEPGDLDSYLIEVPSVPYEERVNDPWAWADTVLAETAPDVAAEIERTAAAIEQLNTTRAGLQSRVAEITSEVVELNAKYQRLTEAVREAGWIKPVRDVLLPRADVVREALATLGNRVIKVAVTSTGQVAWSWGSRQGVIPK